MKMKIKFLFLISFILCSVSCNYGTDNLFYKENIVCSRVSKIEVLSEDYLTALPHKYNFVVITDVHIGSVKKEAPALPDDQFLKWLDDFDSNNRPAFCLCLGDVADTGTASQFEEYARFVEKIEKRGIKVFNSVGNHDMYKSGWDGWKKNCYPNTSFYTFKTPAYSFYSLDTGTGDIGTVQLELIKKSFENDSRPKIVFTHYPLYTEKFFFDFDDTTERNLLLYYFSKYDVKLFLSGHLHKYENMDFGNYETYVIPSYRYNSTWAYVTIDEENKSYNIEMIKAGK